MSRGSSPTRRVRVTRGAAGSVTSTTLTLSDRWFTTQTSVLLRAATAAGSRPTPTAPTWAIEPPVTSNTSRRLSGVFTAKRWVPSGDIASGRTCPVSKRVKGDAAKTGAALAKQRANAKVMDATTRRDHVGIMDGASLGEHE